MQSSRKLYSIVIPARNEAENLLITIPALTQKLVARNIPYEIVVVNDGSKDNTRGAVEEMGSQNSRIKVVDNLPPHGFGNAINKGLQSFSGDVVSIVMADASDDPEDVARFYEKLEEGYDCVFGSRFTKQSVVRHYPRHKYLLNRMVNWFIAGIFGLRYNDTTNAFKCYRREVIEGIRPILSHHFNITVELPLKAIVRGYSYTVIHNHWYGRKIGKSSLKIKEMGSRYLFIILYVWLEKNLSKGDYKRPQEE